MILVIIMISGFVLMHQKEGPKEEIVLKKEDTKKPKETVQTIKFDIKGAVLTPGVYDGVAGMTVMDAILKSGGLLENASTDYINLSKQVKDEMVIIIYTKDEIASQLVGDTSVKVIDQQCVCPQLKNDICINSDKKITNQKSNEVKNQETNPIVSINQATLEEFMTLPGIGEKKAQDILNYRNQVGKFQSIEEIKEVKGIGDATFEKFKAYLTL